MYQTVFDDRHTLIRVSPFGKKLGTKAHSGEYDADILCQDCDNSLLGSLESYASKFLYGAHPKSITTENQLHPDGQLTSTVVDGIDYKQFKLFLLSILWRASISKREFFKQIALGPEEDDIRQMLFQGDPRGQLDYPCTIFSFRGDQKHLPAQIISSPRRIRTDQGFRYLFHIGQFVYMYFVFPNDIPPWVADQAVMPENRLRIVHFTDDTGKIVLKGLFKGTPLMKLVQ